MRAWPRAALVGGGGAGDGGERLGVVDAVGELDGVARPGDTIKLADGVYHAEAFTTVSGTAAAHQRRTWPSPHGFPHLDRPRSRYGGGTRWSRPVPRDGQVGSRNCGVRSSGPLSGVVSSETVTSSSAASTTSSRSSSG